MVYNMSCDVIGRLKNMIRKNRNFWLRRVSPR